MKNWPQDPRVDTIPRQISDLDDFENVEAELIEQLEDEFESEFEYFDVPEEDSPNFSLGNSSC